jgi:hypothetical protein
VPKTIKSILMYIDVYKHVFIKHFWAERCIFGGICGFWDLHAVCMQIRQTSKRYPKGSQKRTKMAIIRHMEYHISIKS